MSSLRNLAKLINESAKEKSVEQEFLFQFNEAISRLDLESGRRPSQSYKPSSIGGCMRNSYYQVVGAELDPDRKKDASNIGILQSGTDRHERMQEAIIQMRRLGFDFDWIDVGEYLKQWPQPGTEVVSKQGHETKLKNTILNMSFLCDGIVQYKGKYYVLEIKTEVSFKWNGRVDVVEMHKSQAASYSTCLGIDGVIFIYENRDFCTKKSFMYEVTEQDKEEKVIHFIATCDSYVERGLVPPMTETKSLCKYCNFKEVCKRDGITEES